MVGSTLLGISGVNVYGKSFVNLPKPFVGPDELLRMNLKEDKVFNFLILGPSSLLIYFPFLLFNGGNRTVVFIFRASFLHSK